MKYCENKPKSEYIVAEYIDYFEVSSNKSFPTDVEKLLSHYHGEIQLRVTLLQWYFVDNALGLLIKVLCNMGFSYS